MQHPPRRIDDIPRRAAGALVEDGRTWSYAALVARVDDYAYKRPAEIVVMERLPAAATGKVLKSELKALAQRMTFGASTAEVASSTKTHL